jgi:hypothetical protein
LLPAPRQRLPSSPLPTRCSSCRFQRAVPAVASYARSCHRGSLTTRRDPASRTGKHDDAPLAAAATAVLAVLFQKPPQLTVSLGPHCAARCATAAAPPSQQRYACAPREPHRLVRYCSYHPGALRCRCPAAAFGYRSSCCSSCPCRDRAAPAAAPSALYGHWSESRPRPPLGRHTCGRSPNYRKNGNPCRFRR